MFLISKRHCCGHTLIMILNIELWLQAIKLAKDGNFVRENGIFFLLIWASFNGRTSRFTSNFHVLFFNFFEIMAFLNISLHWQVGGTNHLCWLMVDTWNCLVIDKSTEPYFKFSHPFWLFDDCVVCKTSHPV